MIIKNIVPAEANIGWIIKLFKLTAKDALSSHYQKTQTQLIIVMEGSAQFQIDHHDFILSKTNMIVIPAMTLHNIIPLEDVAFITLNTPSLNFLEDVNNTGIEKLPFILDKISNEIIIDSDTQIKTDINYTEFSQAYYQDKFASEGYDAYTLCADEEKKWSLAILDIIEAPNHFHKHIRSEHFIVLSGELDIECDKSKYILTPGQSVHVPAWKEHHLRSAKPAPVRVLCINFPAFDEGDFYTKK